MKPSPTSLARHTRGSGTLRVLAPAFAALLQVRASLAALLGLGLARHLLRLVPTLAIGLAVDHVASARAGATLVTVVTLLCLAAAIEAVFAEAQQRLHTGLRTHLAARAPRTDRRLRTRHGAALDLLATAATAPPAMLAMIAALALASGRLAILATALLAGQAIATAWAGSGLGRSAARLRSAERAGELWAADSSTIAEALRAGARARARRLEARRARIAQITEARRDAAARGRALLDRVGFAGTLGLACLDAMNAAITPGALIAVMLVLRQLQSLADGLTASWLRAVEAAAEPAINAGTASRRPARATTIDLVPGEFVVIVGGTAAGKSQLLRAVVERARAAAPPAPRIGVVEQHPRLCDATIAEVLRLAGRAFGAPALRHAIEVSQLARAIRRLPLGLDQPCGPRGEALSAGTRQLVALAGALAADPILLVLDATPDALEPELRAALLRALQVWRPGRMLVVATAVESWITAADRVVVVEVGRVRADLRPRATPRRAA